jgi:Leucine-rich repeat (LRR) protein
MPNRPRLAFLLAAGIVAGCQGYSYTLNERTVFEPPPLFAGYTIEDTALSACVQQAIEDGEIRSAEQLQDLNCSSAGIRALAGIEVFSGLKRLGLDGNRLESLSPLASLTKLELVQARSNRLRELDPALCQGAKKRLAVAGNDTLACAGIATLRACGVVFEDAPAHCPPSG